MREVFSLNDEIQSNMVIQDEMTNLSLVDARTPFLQFTT